MKKEVLTKAFKNCIPEFVSLVIVIMMMVAFSGCGWSDDNGNTKSNDGIIRESYLYDTVLEESYLYDNAQ